jgi:hypothetical protein
MSLASVFEAANQRQGEVIVVLRGGHSFDGVVESLDSDGGTVTIRRRSSPGFSPCPAVTVRIDEVAVVTEAG